MAARRRRCRWRRPARGDSGRQGIDLAYGSGLYSLHGSRLGKQVCRGTDQRKGKQVPRVFAAKPDATGTSASCPAGESSHGSHPDTEFPADRVRLPVSGPSRARSRRSGQSITGTRFDCRISGLTTAFRFHACHSKVIRVFQNSPILRGDNE